MQEPVVLRLIGVKCVFTGSDVGARMLLSTRYGYLRDLVPKNEKQTGPVLSHDMLAKVERTGRLVTLSTPRRGRCYGSDERGTGVF